MGMDLFQQRWMGGFVQYANRIPPGPAAYGPPPYGVWPVSFVRGMQIPQFATMKPEEALREAEKRVEKEHEQKLIEKGKETIAAGLGQGGPVPPTPLMPIKKTDYVALVGGIAVAGAGLITRIVAKEPPMTQTIASAAAILGGVGLVIKGLTG